MKVFDDSLTKNVPFAPAFESASPICLVYKYGPSSCANPTEYHGEDRAIKGTYEC
jgi:hypothetical protein